MISTSLLRINRANFLSNVVTLLPSTTTTHRCISYQYSKRVNCSPKQLYDIVLNVKDYKQFVPYVIESGHNYHYDDPNVSQGHGTGFFELNFQAYTERVDCNIDFTPSTIISRCKTGQLKYLECKWSFQEINNKFTKKNECKVTIDLDYEFNNFLYNQLSQWFTNEITKIMVSSFEKRLRQSKKRYI